MAANRVLHQLSSLLLFQAVFADPVGQAFRRLAKLMAIEGVSAIQLLQAYGLLFQAQAATGRAWMEQVIAQILAVENPFTQWAARSPLAQLPPALVAAARHDLQQLQALAQWDTARWLKLMQPIVGDSDLVSWNPPEMEPTSAIAAQMLAAADWGTLLPALSEHYRQAGVGKFATYGAFRWQGGDLVGVANPDPVRLEDLAGYPSQRQLLIKNTEFLLRGYPALNVLLYGGRGTGKSSLVKALMNQYRDRGLRLVEVAKNDLIDLSRIMEQLRTVPQKFILFVDDLSFEPDEHTYTALKVLLEGSLAARPQNLVVYATSNRRHLVREFYSDRPRPGVARSPMFDAVQEDEVHAWDTVQEKLSFSDRFGLTLTFLPPDQNNYLEMVRHLAQRLGIDLPPEDLEFQALQWATRHHGRSGRSARQFIDFLQAELLLQRSR